MDDQTRNEASAPSSGAVYYDVSPQKILATKATIAVTVFMIVLAVIFCLVRGTYDFTYYLMAVNLLISAIIVLFSCYWYKTGDLDASKWWFLILVGAVVIFQCLTTDIYVFQHETIVGGSTESPPITQSSGGPITLKPATSVKQSLIDTYLQALN